MEHQRRRREEEVKQQQLNRRRRRCKSPEEVEEQVDKLLILERSKLSLLLPWLRRGKVQGTESSLLEELELRRREGAGRGGGRNEVGKEEEVKVVV